MASTAAQRNAAMNHFNFADHDPRDNTKFCPEVFGMKESSSNFFNAAASLNDADSIPVFDDVDSDGYTDENVKQAVAALRMKIFQLYGEELGTKIMKRIPQRVYQSGIHTASNGMTRIAKWGNGERDIWLNSHPNERMIDAGMDSKEVDSFREESKDFIPYNYFRVAMNLLKEIVSKKMLVRIIVSKLHFIHNQNNANENMPNVFMKSIEKFGLDEEVESVPKEFRYFGSDLHPNFRGKGKTAYVKLRRLIFDLSKEAADKESGVTMF